MIDGGIIGFVSTYNGSTVCDNVQYVLVSLTVGIELVQETFTNERTQD